MEKEYVPMHEHQPEPYDPHLHNRPEEQEQQYPQQYGGQYWPAGQYGQYGPQAAAWQPQPYQQQAWPQYQQTWPQHQQPQAAAYQAVHVSAPAGPRMAISHTKLGFGETAFHMIMTLCTGGLWGLVWWSRCHSRKTVTRFR
jgi:hypothetical protein